MAFSETTKAPAAVVTGLTITKTLETSMPARRTPEVRVMMAIAQGK